MSQFSQYPLPKDSNKREYQEGYQQALGMITTSSWDVNFLRCQVRDWQMAQACFHHDAKYLEHIAGLLDCLADVLICHEQTVALIQAENCIAHGIIP